MQWLNLLLSCQDCAVSILTSLVEWNKDIAIYILADFAFLNAVCRNLSGTSAHFIDSVCSTLYIERDRRDI
jgi:hypothetical protein